MDKSIVDIYYDLYEILGDIETVADAIIELQDCKLKRWRLITHLTNLRLHHIEDELNLLYDTRMDKLKEFKIAWNLRKVRG